VRGVRRLQHASGSRGLTVAASTGLSGLSELSSRAWQDLTVLTGPASGGAPPPFLIEPADCEADVQAYRRIRRDVFVAEQGLFPGSDGDDVDDDPRTVVLVARSPEGSVLGGVRLAPVTPAVDLGWWTGSRLVVTKTARTAGGIGAALVRAASAYAEEHGVLRFEATVQAQNEILFRRLGWKKLREIAVAGKPHVHMRWPIGRIQQHAERDKAMLGRLFAANTDNATGRPSSFLGGKAFLGDDGAPVPGTDVVAACDAVLPSMVERDPEWAGWCAVLVNMNDLSAMGAKGIGLLDALGARDESFARRVLRGLTKAAEAWAVPLLGGHTQVGVPASLSVTAIGRTARLVPGGGGRAGHSLSLTADTTGQWRPGYTGRQWDSTSAKPGAELRELGRLVRRADPAAAKDVSMVGIVGTTGMLAEASGCGAVLDVGSIPRPASAAMGDWLSCFPGYAMVTADRPGAGRMGSPLASTAECGELVEGAGVQLRWPDGMITEAISNNVTGLGSTQA
jgi:putative N-acetyltransferase (TIGR04045 family)